MFWELNIKSNYIQAAKHACKTRIGGNGCADMKLNYGKPSNTLVGEKKSIYISIYNSKTYIFLNRKLN